VSTTEPQAQTGPLPFICIEPSRGWLSLNLRELWAYRELLYFLIWRDVKVRYKQTAIGAAWAVLQPFLTMVIFGLVFKKFANVPSDGLPYSIFAYTALLPWGLFAGAVNRSSLSIVGQAGIISKVYFPRLIVPLSATISGLVDFAVALMFALTTALAVGLWLSALNVKYRDVMHAVPFLIQIWLFASPIAYPVSLVPEKWRLLYSLNPLVGVIEGFRWALLGKESPDFGVIAISASAVIALLFTGLIYFKRMERTFADVV
jgi:lipopolysaccharide transport system permease protein